MSTGNVGEYSSPDFKLCSVLKVLGFPHTGVKLSGMGSRGNIYSVVFEDTPELQKAILDYENLKLRLDPVQLFNMQSVIHRLTHPKP